MPTTTPKDSSSPPKPDPQGDRRKNRLAEQLRANLQRRKAQARSRRSGEADQRPEGLATTEETATRAGEDEETG